MPLSNNPELSVVVPFYRAAAEFAGRLNELVDFGENSAFPIQLILVDDGSEDNNLTQTLESCAQSRAGIVFIRHEINLGKGRSVADGIAAAGGTHIVFIDGDLPYELAAITAVHQTLLDDQRIHFVVGSRRHQDSMRTASYSLARRAASWLYSRGVQVILGLRCSDVGCGLKGFRADAARLLFSNLLVARFAFDVEIFARASKYRLDFKEIPVVFRQNDHGTLRIIPAGLRMIKDVFRVYVRYKKPRA